MNGKLVNTVEDVNKLLSIETMRSANPSVLHVHLFPGPKVRKGDSRVAPLYPETAKQAYFEDWITVSVPRKPTLSALTLI